MAVEERRYLQNVHNMMLVLSSYLSALSFIFYFSSHGAVPEQLQRMARSENEEHGFSGLSGLVSSRDVLSFLKTFAPLLSYSLATRTPKRENV